MAHESGSDAPLSHPPTHDAPLTAEQHTRLQRAKRERRRRDAAEFPITGRDEALYWLDAFATNELLRQPEVRSRLAHVAATRAEGIPRRRAFEWWLALERLDRDLDSVLRGAGELERLTRDWPKVEARLDIGWPVFGSGGPVGRPGIEQTMTVESVLPVLRSIALRPRAREKIAHGAIPEYRSDFPSRAQSGHEHAQGEHAHGASYADELAAAEVNEREGRSGKYAITGRHVEKQRARLGVLLTQARFFQA
jgi:hypothetical protein